MLDTLLFLVLTPVIVLLLLWKYLCGNTRFATLGNKIPGPPGLPIFGHSLSIPTNGPEGLKYRYAMVKEYGHITKLWVGKYLFVFLSDPDDCEVLLRSTKHLTKSVIYNFFHSWLGTGLLTSTGEKWHKRRKAITPAFHFSILENFIDVFNKNGDVLIECLKQRCNGTEVDIQPFISRYTLDVICETAMGTQVHAQLGHNSQYVKAVRRMCDLISERFRNPWLHFKYIYYLSGRLKDEEKSLRILHDYTNKVISEKINNLSFEENETYENEEGLKNRKAFLELLLKMKISGNSAFQTNGDIREEVNTFMFEGHDTTATCICFTLVLLSKHKEIQEKLYEELIQAMDHQNEVTYKTLCNMKYLECIIKESLRLYPSVPLIAREITEDLDMPSGYTLPAGAVAAISIYFLHRNEKSYKNPYEFKPDNFLHENMKNRHPYAYIPFSAGPRNCIGQKFAMLELKSILSKIILNFSVEPAGDDWKIIEDPNVVFQSLNGHRVKLNLRQKTV